MHAHKGYRKSPVAQEERAPSDFDTWRLARDPNRAPAGSDAPRRGVGALDRPTLRLSPYSITHHLAMVHHPLQLIERSEVSDQVD